MAGHWSRLDLERAMDVHYWYIINIINDAGTVQNAKVLVHAWLTVRG
jgi:hypothetical protein